MKLSFRNVGVFSCAAGFLAIASMAHASNISGTAYCGIQANTGGQGSVYAIQAPTTTTLADAESTSEGQCASFSATQINFNTGYGNSGTSLSSFLNSDPGLLSSSYTAQNAANGAPAATATGSQSSDGTLLVITGDAFLTNGESISLSHDDGANLYVTDADGNTYLISPSGSDNQTVGGQPPFTFDEATGEYSFELIYTSNYEQPSELVSSIGATPEPSSLILLGTGLFGAAGLLRRRLFV